MARALYATKSMLLLFMFVMPGLCWSADYRDRAAALALGDWAPESREVVSALDVLKLELAMWERKLGMRAFPFKEYRFQYFGLIKDAKKTIMLNAFCSDYWEDATDWKEKAVMVAGGGSCFFQAEYSMDKSGIISLTFNKDS